MIKLGKNIEELSIEVSEGPEVRFGTSATIWASIGKNQIHWTIEGKRDDFTKGYYWIPNGDDFTPWDEIAELAGINWLELQERADNGDEEAESFIDEYFDFVGSKIGEAMKIRFPEHYYEDCAGTQVEAWCDLNTPCVTFTINDENFYSAKIDKDLRHWRLDKFLVTKGVIDDALDNGVEPQDIEYFSKTLTNFLEMVVHRSNF